MKIYLIAAILLVLAGCKNDKDLTDPTQIITTGTWRVSHFMDNGADETPDFLGYSFVFNTDGSVVATKNGVQKYGTWLKNSATNEMNINMGPNVDTNKPLGELTDDWEIATFTSTQISLFDDSSTDEMLVFLKN
jgi:uncharacterized lipoprotein NlpE involved in copper resistance